MRVSGFKVARRRAVRLAVLAGLVASLGACSGITPMKSLPDPEGELSHVKPGVFSGDQGSITLYERK